MSATPLLETPPPILTEAFIDAGAAVSRLEEIYERNTEFLRNRFEAYVNGLPFTTRVRAHCPWAVGLPPRRVGCGYAAADKHIRGGTWICA